MNWLRRLLARVFKRRRNEPFALTETITVRISPVELGMFQTDAQRNGFTLDQWVREKLNKGVSQGTLLHLSKGHNQSALEAAFNLDDDYQDPRVIPLGPRRAKMNKPRQISGHPCQFLDPTLPPNMTANECQGVCAKRKPGWTGRPCYWSGQAAKNCDEFATKINLPVGNPGVR
jgi:hypothetical protein